MRADTAPLLAPPLAIYRGAFTKPERWSLFRPRRGDVIVCTPSKCGTTWTQTMIAMLLHGGPDLPDRVGALSPWIDADLGDIEDVAGSLAAQPGRRVIKTHTPADGFPVWEDVTVVTVMRHPLDVFLSLRSHAENQRSSGDDHPMKGPLLSALDAWLTKRFDREDIDRDSLGEIAAHHRAAVSGRLPRLLRLHYADMRADGHAAVARLAEALGIVADRATIDAVAEATGFEQMKAAAGQFAPAGGAGFWKDDGAFFAAGRRGAWAREIPPEGIGAFRAHLARLIPDAGQRRWIEEGSGAGTA